MTARKTSSESKSIWTCKHCSICDGRRSALLVSGFPLDSGCRDFSPSQWSLTLMTGDKAWLTLYGSVLRCWEQGCITNRADTRLAGQRWLIEWQMNGWFVAHNLLRSCHRKQFENINGRWLNWCSIAVCKGVSFKQPDQGAMWLNSRVFAILQNEVLRDKLIHLQRAPHCI